MASRPEFVRYAADQMRDAGEITCRKMFGEYGVYCDGKIFAVICDDQLYIKITEGGRAVCPNLEQSPPYEGAKNYFLVEEIDDRELLTELVRATVKELPPPKPKKPKKSEGDSRRSKKENQNQKLDYKKEFPDLYLPKRKPAIVNVPSMVFLQVEGKGDPNISQDYRNSLEILYGLSFGIKMGLKFGSIPGELLPEASGSETEALERAGGYVIPPLEGLWRTEDATAFDGRNLVDKDRLCWISMIRQPDLVTEQLFAWAKDSLKRKKPHLNLSPVRLVRYTEGLCCQALHVGPYDAEPDTIERLEQFIEDQGYVQDFDRGRYHHEIYLGDPRRTAPERLKTVIRHPVKKQGEYCGA